MSFLDSTRQNDRRLPPNQAENTNERSRPRRSGGEAQRTPLGKSMAENNVNGLDARFRSEVRADDLAQLSSLGRDREFTTFQTSLRKGKVRLCSACGGVMTRSSRMVLSPWSGLMVLIMGSLLMALYGLATYFFQPPWLVQFALPAAYYVGSLFAGVGILFFFIRERIWYCRKCKEIDKR